MAEQKRTPLNHLLSRLTPGQMVDSAWLQEQGISRPSIHDYVQSGWLERVASRVYRRATPAGPNGPVRWDVALMSAQQLRPASFYVGGLTALELLGQSHYARLGAKRPIHLYDSDGTIPSWLLKLPADATFIVHKRRLFVDQDLSLEWRRLDLGTGRLGSSVPTPETREPWDHFVRIAGAERAAIETMDAVPDAISFEYADALFEGLTNLRPRLLSSLLQSCTSIRAKRLFLFYADRHDHSWSKHLDRSSVDLGRGKRQLTPGGKLDTHYQITVPAALIAPMGNAAP